MMVLESQRFFNGLSCALWNVQKDCIVFGKEQAHFLWNLGVKCLPVAKPAVTPELDFSVGCWSAAVRACPHAMHIGAARMLGPNAGFALQHRGLEGMVLLNAQITHRVAGLVGADQLRLVVEESLAPLRMAGSHGQHPALQR